jgi:hypothetical protein
MKSKEFLLINNKAPLIRGFESIGDKRSYTSSQESEYRTLPKMTLVVLA